MIENFIKKYGCYPYQYFGEIEGEVWKPIDWFKGLDPTYYSVSNYGRIKSNDRTVTYSNGVKHFYEGLIMQQEYSKRYLHLLIQSPTFSKNCRVHRLVAKAFIENENNYPYIDHISTDRLDNTIINLRWCTNSMNCLNPITKEKKDKIMNSKEYKEKMSNIMTNNPKLSKRVGQYTLDGELVKIWESTNECGRNGYKQSHIAACCRGERKKHHNFIWRYIDDTTETPQDE